jgi:hypothetical protein
MIEKEKYYKYLIKLAQDQQGDFNFALIDTVAKQCLGLVQDTIKDIEGDEKWTPLGVAESIELRLAGLFLIDLHQQTGDTHEPQDSDSTADS